MLVYRYSSTNLFSDLLHAGWKSFPELYFVGSKIMWLFCKLLFLVMQDLPPSRYRNSYVSSFNVVGKFRKFLLFIQHTASLDYSEESLQKFNKFKIPWLCLYRIEMAPKGTRLKRMFNSLTTFLFGLIIRFLLLIGKFYKSGSATMQSIVAVRTTTCCEWW